MLDLHVLRNDLLKLTAELDMVVFRYNLSYEDSQVLRIKASVEDICKRLPSN